EARGGAPRPRLEVGDAAEPRDEHRGARPREQRAARLAPRGRGWPRVYGERAPRRVRVPREPEEDLGRRGGRLAPRLPAPRPLDAERAREPLPRHLYEPGHER